MITHENHESLAVNRIAWQCRRGMRELDELLGAFLLQNTVVVLHADRQLIRVRKHAERNGRALPNRHQESELPDREVTDGGSSARAILCEHVAQIRDNCSGIGLVQFPRKGDAAGYRSSPTQAT